MNAHKRNVTLIDVTCKVANDPDGAARPVWQFLSVERFL